MKQWHNKTGSDLIKHLANLLELNIDDTAKLLGLKRVSLVKYLNNERKVPRYIRHSLMAHIRLYILKKELQTHPFEPKNVINDAK